MQVTGDSTGQTWFGILTLQRRCSGIFKAWSPDGGQANFGGYKELVLDNLVIEKVTEEVTAGRTCRIRLVGEAEEKYKEVDYRPEIWSSFQDVLKEAKAVLDKEGASTG